jgi:ABC-type multidrug transport system fused ATPase/permease subunit
MYIWVYTGEANAKRIREKYLQAVLRQDIQFFDNVGAGEVTTRIQMSTRKSIFISGTVTCSNFFAQIWYSKESQRKLLSLSTSWQHSLLVLSLPTSVHGVWHLRYLQFYLALLSLELS